MRYRMLGSTGLRVSVIGLGTWQFGGEWGRSFSQEDVDAILDAGAAEGMNIIDTAECYGDHLAERLIGDYLSRHERGRWVVASKFGHEFQGFMSRVEDFTAASVRKQLESTLRTLRLETIDLYQFHSGPDSAFLNHELWQMLGEQQRVGKIRHLGVSILGKGSELQAREARGMGAEALQVVYNWLDRRPEQYVFPHAQRERLGVLARVPLASGFLTGKFRPGASFPSNDVRATFGREKIRHDLEEVERLRQTELPAGIAMGTWALGWCLRNPLVSAVIPGCKDPAQVKANALAADLPRQESP